jgi:hypothetical protein
MRRASALLGIAAAIVGMIQLLLGRGDIFAATIVIYSAALIVSAVAALRGSAIIYLATSWGIYLGTTLAAYMEVDYTFLKQGGPVAAFGGAILSMLIILEVLGLGLAILAFRKEAST